MPVPHDYYAPWSDEPHLHNRHHSRPYIEPDWQAHAAGHQLPVLSTIGRGPRGYGLKAANFDFSDSYFSFDLVSDSTGEVEQHIGPIPTGEVDMDTDETGTQIMFMTNVIGTDSEGHPIIRKTTKTLTLPKGEDGSRAYVRDSSGGSLEQTENNVYTMDWADLVYYNPETGDHTGYPQPRVYDLVVFETYKDVVEEGETVRKTYLQFGHVFDAEDPSALVVSSHYAFDMSSLKGLKGDKGDKGDPGQDGTDGADGADGADGVDGVDGANGIDCEHEWNGTVLTIKSASGISSADLRGPEGPPGSSSGIDLATAYGILPVSKGGTGTATASANYVFAGPTSGNAAAPSFRKLVAADIPTSLPSTSIGGSAAKLATPRSLYTSLSTSYDSSNPVTFDGSAGKVLPVSGTLPVKNGGTGRATLTANAILAGNGTSAVKMISTASGALYATSAGAAPQFGQLPVAQGGTGASSAANARTNLGLGTAATHAHGDYALANHTHNYAAASHTHAASDITSGTFGIARGGTGRSTLTSGSYLVGNGTSAVALKTPSQVLSDIGAASSSHTHSKTMDQFDNLNGNTITAIPMAASKYTSTGVSGWSYRKYLAPSASFFMYHAIGLVKIPSGTAVTTVRGNIFVSSTRYVRLPVKARVLQCVTFGTSMGGGDNGLTCNNAGTNNAGDWHATTDSLINIPVVVASPVSLTTAADQYVPVDVWFSAVS